jgi:DNA modification methylase
VSVIEGDCRNVMAGMEPESVDAIVTDPPYGISFMGKGWDHGVPGVEFWTAALRVLKPGSHLLAFGGTRTFHRLACAIEDAGFEIRDCLSWLYGSGFPKSLDVSKAIDKVAVPDALADFIADVRAAAKAKGYTYRTLNDTLGGQAIAEHVLKPSSSNAAWPTRDTYDGLKAALDLGERWDWLYSDVRGAERPVIGDRHVPKGHAFAGPTYGGDSSSQVVDITAPATPEAERWAGWGTALKPAWEPVIVARKPLSERTVAANVLAHGTGALNIDGTRIGYASDADKTAALAGDAFKRKDTSDKSAWARPWMDDPERVAQLNAESKARAQAGRWPANVILDEPAAALLDQMSGISTSRSGNPNRRSRSDGTHTYFGAKSVGTEHNDTGGASRFMYVAKASRRERNAGLDGMPERGRVDDHNLLSSTFRTDPRSPNGGYENKPAPPQSNHHPTVKPIALMRWLVRLVTPAGGLILDPFMGSGSTGCAAVLEGFRFVGIEQDAEYAAIAERRITHWTPRTIQPALPLEGAAD